MKAIILAAGYGNRMRPLTDQTHKTLLSVGEKTILSRIIDGLLENNIMDILIGTGFRAEEIQEYVEKAYPEISFSFVHNERFRETNNIFSLALAFDSIEITSDIIVIESDLIYDPSVIAQLIQSPYDNVAMVDKFRSGMDGTVVTVDNNGVITSVIPPHLQDEDFSFSDKYKTLNIYKFSEEFCKTSFKKLLSYYANVIDDNCYYELILGILIYMQKEVIHAGIVKNEWAEVDDPNDLAVAEYIFNKDRKKILQERFGGFWNYDVLDFTFIRNMYFPDSSIISEMKNNLANLIHNYGSKQTILNRKMAWFLLCKEERVIALNGASQIYPIMQQRFAGQKILVPKPTFGEYTRIFDNVVFYHDEVGIDTGDITKAMTDCGVIVIVNPNNPTGTTISTDWIYETATSNPNKTFVVDESFIEFSDTTSIVSTLETNPLDNIIVVKSLSKSLGIPGVRLGYTYSCNEEFNTYSLERVPIWNMNSLAEFTLEIILKHRKALQRSFEETIHDRRVFISDLSELEITDCAYKSGGNFILVRLKEGLDCEQVVERMLKENSIYIKNVSGKFKSGGKFLRLAVRLPEENRLLVEKLGKICKG